VQVPWRGIMHITNARSIPITNGWRFFSATGARRPLTALSGCGSGSPPAACVPIGSGQIAGGDKAGIFLVSLREPQWIGPVRNIRVHLRAFAATFSYCEVGK
jgi:hypothetical protein